MLQDQDLIAIQEVRTKVDKAHAAWKKYRHFTQEQVDAIVERMAAAGRANAQQLAEMAVEETGYGNAKDKLAKNLLCADLLPRTIHGMKTVGFLREVPEQKVVEYGVPMGVVAAILPTTNPTSTVIYKSIISLKSGNGIVISPHPRAKNCTCYTADLLYRAALEAGAPEDIIQCISNPTLEATQALMKHERTAVILATGGTGLVRAAYSSGKPAYGVGPGNVPVLIEKTADIADAITKVVSGKSFDYGTVCSSEQTIVSTTCQRDAILAQLQANGAYICTDQERDAVSRLLITPSGGVNPKCVGQSPQRIAQMAGFAVPASTVIIAAEIQGVGRLHPLSAEKLSPVLALLFVKDFAASIDSAQAILEYGGLGHTCVIYSKDDARIREFAVRMPAYRVLVNTSAPQGSTGITTGIQPAMTLGCGAVASNSTSDNVGPQHLINIKRLAYVVRTPEEAFPPADGSRPTVAPAPMPAPAKRMSLPPAGSPERQAVMTAVEEYLAKRGLKLSDRPAPPAPAPAPAPRPAPAPVAARPAAPTGRVIEQVVDRFLGSKRAGVAAACSAAKSAGNCGCGCGSSKPKTQSPVVAPPAPVSAPKPAPAPPPPPIVDFVCESDVRSAIQKSQKIYVGPKTIITPAAREVANTADVIVLVSK